MGRERANGPWTGRQTWTERLTFPSRTYPTCHSKPKTTGLEHCRQSLKRQQRHAVKELSNEEPKPGSHAWDKTRHTKKGWLDGIVTQDKRGEEPTKATHHPPITWEGSSIAGTTGHCVTASPISDAGGAEVSSAVSSTPPGVMVTRVPLCSPVSALHRV